jgi:hypothetical protein
MLTWQKVVLYPLAIYAAIFLFISALIGFKIDQTAPWASIASYVISIAGLYIASRAAKMDTRKNAVLLGLSWVIVMVILDLILTRPFTGWGYFQSWQAYLSYALTFIIPSIFSAKK